MTPRLLSSDSVHAMSLKLSKTTSQYLKSEECLHQQEDKITQSQYQSSLPAAAPH